MKSRIYVGRLIHARNEPVRHAFEYPVWYLALDLGELDVLDGRLRLFGVEHPRPVSFHPRDHLGGGEAPLVERARAAMERAGIDCAGARVELITAPRVFGHAFNPASFYRFLDGHERTLGHLVEVNNTFGEGHLYPLPPAVEAKADKSFHVSPFYPVDGRYTFRFDDWGERLDLRIDLERDGGRSFHARIRAEARPLDDRALLGILTRRPLTVAATLPRILRQAFTLYLRKGLEYRVKPKPDDARTYLSTRPPWISEFRLPRPLERLGRWALRAGDQP